MKALVITLPRDKWPASMPNHFHIAAKALSRHMVAAVQSNYRNATVNEYEFEKPFTCPECGQELR